MIGDEWTACLQTLGLRPEASMAQIQEAYRRHALAFHPDSNGGVGAVERFRQAAEAYRSLAELGRMRQAAEAPDLLQAVMLDPVICKMSTGRLKGRLRRSSLWQVRASAAAALGLRGEPETLGALQAARQDPHPRVREAARRVLAQMAGPGGSAPRWKAPGPTQPLGGQAARSAPGGRR